MEYSLGPHIMHPSFCAVHHADRAPQNQGHRARTPHPQHTDTSRKTSPRNMTRLCMDPATLRLQYPRASHSAPVRIRVVAQVSRYDAGNARLFLVRCANLARAEVFDIDAGAVCNTDSEIGVDVSGVMAALGPHQVMTGAVVSVWGMFDGNEIYAVECAEVNGGVLVGGSEVMAQLAALQDL